MSGFAVVAVIRELPGLGIEGVGPVDLCPAGVEHRHPYRLLPWRPDVSEPPLVPDPRNKGIERVVLDVLLVAAQVNRLQLEVRHPKPLKRNHTPTVDHIRHGTGT